LADIFITLPFRETPKKIFKMLPVLRGFSRNVKQDSVANEVSVGMMMMQPAVPWYLR
jgi:hypothetical protein